MREKNATKAAACTGDSSSSCEMIILRNKSHGEIIRVCMGIFMIALRNKKKKGKISAQPHTIVKQICFPNGNVLFLSLFPLFKN